HARGAIAPRFAARFLRRAGEPEVAFVHFFEAFALEKHAAHFAAGFAVVAADADELVAGKVLTEIIGGRLAALLSAENVRAELLDRRKGQIAPRGPEVPGVEDKRNAQIKGHHAQIRGRRNVGWINLGGGG